MKYKQIDIKEAADRFRNGEAVYAARCIDGMRGNSSNDAAGVGNPGSRNRDEAGKKWKNSPPNKEDHRPGEGKSIARGRVEQCEDCR